MIKLGLGVCGSYCTYSAAFAAFEELCLQYDVTAIMSGNAAKTDSRFGKAADFRAQLEALTGKPVIDSIADAEPVGPKALFELMLIAPCTGNTLAKLAHGITDSSVTMAAKGHLRNGRPLLLAPSTNDGLSGSAANIGALLNRRNVYFLPFGQDDPLNKPRSVFSDYSALLPAVEAALGGRQLQPLLITVT